MLSLLAAAALAKPITMVLPPPTRPQAVQQPAGRIPRTSDQVVPCSLRGLSARLTEDQLSLEWSGEVPLHHDTSAACTIAGETRLVHLRVLAAAPAAPPVAAGTMVVSRLAATQRTSIPWPHPERGRGKATRDGRRWRGVSCAVHEYAWGVRLAVEVDTLRAEPGPGQCIIAGRAVPVVLD